MEIKHLSDQSDFAPLLARWHFDEWRDLYPDWTFERVLAELRTHDDPDRVPTTLLALDDAGELLGSVSLVIDDLPGYEHFTPWLASLYVRPDRRAEGIGGALIRQVVAEARRLHVARLYLFTPHHEDYYAARGWSLVERSTAGHQPVAIMCRETGLQRETCK